MPIKFRCDHCKQLIGIAQSKAGSLVDCPTCGRTVRVPNKDGIVEPLPKPQINHADGLRNALNELAQIGQEEESSNQSGAATALTPSSAKGPSPGEPRSVDVPVDRQANSVALEPLPPMKVVDPPSPRRAPIPIPQSPATPETISPERALAEISIPMIPLRPGNAAAQSKTAGVSVLVLIIACVGSLLVGAAAGFVAGRNSTASSVTKPQTTSNEAQPQPAPQPAQPQISGTLTYRDAKQKQQPDSGACVILLPTKPDAEHKLSVIGLRPSDDDVARQAAISSLEEQGGKLVQTDDDGHYQIEVPGEGEYQLLALSHFQGQPADAEVSKTRLEALGKYFDRPTQLVGKLAFQVKSIKHPGTGDVTWDCKFGEK